MGGVEVAEGAGVTLYTFQIRDKFTKETVYYDYFGGTISGPGAFPGSVTLPEDGWTDFSIAEPGLKVTDLSGGVDIGSVGPVNVNPAVAPLPGVPGYVSKTYVVLKGRRAINGAADIAIDLPGTTLGAGIGSVSKGYMRHSGAKFKTP